MELSLPYITFCAGVIAASTRLDQTRDYNRSKCSHQRSKIKFFDIISATKGEKDLFAEFLDREFRDPKNSGSSVMKGRVNKLKYQ
ncbi:unnamed protein product [Rhizophagus irregularis]|nr:unnamed protein product [Rhizophagus irregularis]CAB5352058.1 unnamed protein product [Rhizophagus irregularis]